MVGVGAMITGNTAVDIGPPPRHVPRSRAPTIPPIEGEYHAMGKEVTEPYAFVLPQHQAQQQHVQPPAAPPRGVPQLLGPPDRETAILMAIDRLSAALPKVAASGKWGPWIALAIVAAIVIAAGSFTIHEIYGDKTQAAEIKALRDAQLDYIDVQEERHAWEEERDARFAEKLGATLPARPDTKREVRRIRRTLTEP